MTATTIRQVGAAAVGAHGSMCVLVIGDGTCATHQLPATGDVTIGRVASCGIPVDDPSISRRHALLRLGPQVTIEDLGSANGVRRRGERLTPGQPVPVAPGDVLDLGAVMVILQARASTTHTRWFWPHGYFEGRLAEECGRATAARATFALLRLHVEDAPSEELVRTVFGDLLRPGDVVGMYAPGEYEVLLLETSPAGAREWARNAAEALGGFRARVGVACFPQDARSPDELIARSGAAARGRSELAGARPASVVAEGAMPELHRVVERIAAGKISVLILGETGVGKEVLAEMIHRKSPRAAQPFLRLNCAALSESLLESELFGHERGAFTSAVGTKQGLLETAHGGTVFLDEVGELPLATQVKLLRVIEERRVMRVGAVKSRDIDVRFVAATNRDLDAAVAAGTFRQDLLFRINGIALVIPPLRERVSEIEGLARAFLADNCRAAACPVPALSADALALLQGYSWPGNIRELRNFMERAVLLSQGERIRPEHFPLEKMRAALATPAVAALAPPPCAAAPTPVVEPAAPAVSPAAADGPVNMRGELGELERRRILEALVRCGGNQTRAAELLGMPRRTLIKRLDVYGAVRPRKGRA